MKPAKMKVASYRAKEDGIQLDVGFNMGGPQHELFNILKPICLEITNVPPQQQEMLQQYLSDFKSGAVILVSEKQDGLVKEHQGIDMSYTILGGEVQTDEKSRPRKPFFETEPDPKVYRISFKNPDQLKGFLDQIPSELVQFDEERGMRGLLIQAGSIAKTAYVVKAAVSGPETERSNIGFSFS